MKKNEILKRLSALILSGTMIFAMGTSVFAAESASETSVLCAPGDQKPDPPKPKTIKLTKKISAGDNVKAPNTSFTFEVSAAEQETDNNQVVTAYEGVLGGLYFAEGDDTITFTPDATSLTNTTEISVDVSKFNNAGVYHYKVKETAGSYDGMDYDTKVYDVYVYVENSDKGLEISAVESRLNGKKSDITFDNKYNTNKLTLKKVIEGKQANMSKEFKFELTINGAAGEKYTAVNGNDVKTITSGTSVEYNLGNGETVVIYGLSASDTYTIVEEDCSKDGYVTTITGDGTIDKTNKLKIDGTEGTTDKKVTYTNKKEVNPPTGIITNVLPYVLMVVAAAGLAFVFLRKKEYDR